MFISKHIWPSDDVKAIKHNNKIVDVTPAARQHHLSTACVSPTDTLDIITLPTPASGKAFKKIEVVNLMSKVPVGHIPAAMAKAIMKHQKQYNVSVSKVSIYHLLANNANGTVILGEFTGKGRPPICSDTDMKQISKSVGCLKRSLIYKGCSSQLMSTSTKYGKRPLALSCPNL